MARLWRPVLDDLDAVLDMRRVVSSDACLLWLSDKRFDEDDLRNWRRRWFDPAAEAVGIDTTPKSARHASRRFRPRPGSTTS